MSFNVFNRHHGASAMDMAAKTSSAAKTAVNTLDKGARSVGTSLKRGLRSAVKNFNPAKLSAKVSPFDGDSVKRAKDYGSGAVHAQEQQTAQRMKQQRPPSAQQAHAQRIQEERKQYMARWDREHPAALRPEPQARPRPAPQPAPQAPAPWQAGHREQFATPLQLERPTAEQTRLANLPIEDRMPQDDVDAILQARQQLDQIGERNQARRARQAQQPWKPAYDPNIPRSDFNAMRQQERFQRVLDQPDHPDLSSRERKQLMQEQAHARAGLDALAGTHAAHNASNARFDRETKLLGERDRIDARMARLDPAHPDFDWVTMDRAPAQREALTRQRARITNQLKEMGYSDDN